MGALSAELAAISGVGKMQETKITKKEVEYVAKLARLDLSEEEKTLFSHQLNDILIFAEKINELNTEGVLPTSHPLSLENVFRQDEVKESLPSAEVLSNAPQKKMGYFKVPKVIE